MNLRCLDKRQNEIYPALFQHFFKLSVVLVLVVSHSLSFFLSTLDCSIKQYLNDLIGTRQAPMIYRWLDDTSRRIVRRGAATAEDEDEATEADAKDDRRI